MFHRGVRRHKHYCSWFGGIFLVGANIETDRRRNIYCEERAPPAVDVDRTNEKRGGDQVKKVLIVGCGLTGVLTAHQLHRHYNCRSQNTTTRLQIEIMERATYPAGRVGAQANFRGAIANLGAQVLSTVNPDDPRALGGHGVTRDNLQTAQSIVMELQRQKLLELVPNSALGETEERMIWEGLWQHYIAPQGLTSVLKALLPVHVHPEFGIRIDSLTKLNNNGKLQVSGLRRRSTTGSLSVVQFQKTYDAVILCVSAPDVLAIEGLSKLLDVSSQHILKTVGYDSRTCEAHFFDPRLRPAFAKLFNEDRSGDNNGNRRQVLEINLEDTTYNQRSHNLSYLSWQDPKHKIPMEDTQTPCSVVVHCKAEYHVDNPQPLDTKALDFVLSEATGIPVETIEQYRLYKKSIPWQVSQMIRPMEAVVGDPLLNCSWQCLVSPSEATLIVAGDFMTQSSFVGCVATADAAAKVAIDTLVEDR